MVVRYSTEQIEIEVNDDGQGQISPAGGGHGLIGMRERAAAYSGELRFGQCPGGGHVIRAVLKVPSSQ